MVQNRSLRPWIAVSAAVLLGGGLPMAIVGATALPAAAASSANVTVNASQTLGSIPSGAIGLNTAVYDGSMTDSAIPGLLKSAGIGSLRYPGGSYGDIYNWQTNTAQGGYDAPNTAFDANFIPLAQSAGAQPIIIANYGTGTPSLAASWVQDADVTHNDGIKYWEIGNEVYGNGTYGSNWEADAHCDTSVGGSKVTIGGEPSQTYDCGPTAYANNWLQFQSAMKAVDPNIKVCAVLTTPGFWPDGVTNSQYSTPWNQTVLSTLKSNVDCVIVHYYPGGSNTASMLQDPSDIAGIVSTLHSQIGQYAGIGNPASVPIMVTETNSSIDMDTMPAALFAADMYTTWLESGATNVDWWNEHNGAGTVSTVNGATDYGDQGVFSNGTSPEPAVDTPFESYYGIEMLTRLLAAGDNPVASSSSQSLIAAHAVRRANGDLDVLLVNKDPSNSYTVNLTYNGFTPSSAVPAVDTLATNATSITTAQQGSATSQTVGPYSLTVIHLQPSGASPSPSPSHSASPSPSASASASPSPSPSKSASPSASPSASSGSGSLTGEYLDYSTTASTNQVKPGLQVVNNSTAGIPLSQVTIRYWFDQNGGASTYATNCYYALVGCGNVTEQVVSLSSPLPGADHYLQVGFTSAAGTLAAGASSGDLQAEYNKTDWSNFNQANDYSYNTNTAYQAWSHITVYINGTLVWGTEP